MTISHDTSAPLFVVVGATGNQGGSVIKMLSESSGHYRIRALTRDATKPRAEELSRAGVEMIVVGPVLENKIEIFKAFEGATYAFDAALGKLYVDAAFAAKVQLLLWAGLPDMAMASEGKYKRVGEFDGKAEVSRYAQDVGIPFVNIQPGWYMQEFLTVDKPKKQKDGSFAVFGVGDPQTLVPLVDSTRDYGVYVLKAIELFETRSIESGHDILAFTEEISFDEIMAQLSENTSQKVVYVKVDEKQFLDSLMLKDLTRPQALDTLEMYQAMAEFGYYGKQSAGQPLQGLAKIPRTWREFIKENDWSEVLS
ncbi:hypothetical protein FRB97_003833 [Tulasnella sp. 331]|nr:hypothetical protein FRB97_003833 [Tulasnella sp. 331]KAG8882201.1 hypothetical protein FRB98_003872 [Tulasnella sp. 332]